MLKMTTITKGLPIDEKIETTGFEAWKTSLKPNQEDLQALAQGDTTKRLNDWAAKQTEKRKINQKGGLDFEA